MNMNNHYWVTCPPYEARMMGQNSDGSDICAICDATGRPIAEGVLRNDARTVVDALNAYTLPKDPWIDRDSDGVIGIMSEDGVGIADCVYRRADRALINAAPELLEALTWLYYAHSDGQDKNSMPMEKARAAIAKAIGFVRG